MQSFEELNDGLNKVFQTSIKIAGYFRRGKKICEIYWENVEKALNLYVIIFK